MDFLEILNVQLGCEKCRIVSTVSVPTNSSKELVLARELITLTVCCFVITLAYAC